jgi:transposase
MRPPIPEQVRRVIVRLKEEGRTYDEIANLVGVGRATVSRILRLHRETGGLRPSEPGGGNLSPIRGKIQDSLRRLVETLPDATVSELGEALIRAEKLATSRASVHRALVRMGYTRKKSRSSR